MKKITLALGILFIFIALPVSAQETWTGDNGLSNSRCNWMSVTMKIVKKDKKNKEVWKKCTAQDKNCVSKFCTGASSADKENNLEAYWEKENCNKYCITLQEQLPIEGGQIKSISGDSGVGLLSSYFNAWYRVGALILGLIAVLVIVVSGVQISMGGASEEGVTAAKTRIMAAILSLVLLFSSALILHTINPLFFT